MIFWLTMFLLGVVIVGYIHSTSNSKFENEQKLKRIKKRLAEKEAEESLKLNNKLQSKESE